MMSRDFSAYNKVVEQCRRIHSPKKITATAMIHRWIPKITQRKSKATENADVRGRWGKREEFKGEEEAAKRSQ